MEDIFELTPKQKEAFKNLQKAFDDCDKSGLGFYNNYGAIGVFDKQKISLYDDKNNSTAIVDEGQNALNEITKYHLVSWTDDTHYFHPK